MRCEAPHDPKARAPAQHSACIAVHRPLSSTPTRPPASRARWLPSCWVKIRFPSGNVPVPVVREGDSRFGRGASTSQLTLSRSPDRLRGASARSGANCSLLDPDKPSGLSPRKRPVRPHPIPLPQPPGPCLPSVVSRERGHTRLRRLTSTAGCGSGGDLGHQPIHPRIPLFSRHLGRLRLPQAVGRTLGQPARDRAGAGEVGGGEFSREFGGEQGDEVGGCAERAALDDGGQRPVAHLVVPTPTPALAPSNLQLPLFGWSKRAVLDPSGFREWCVPVL